VATSTRPRSGSTRATNWAATTPSLALVVPLERMLQAPHDPLSAWEPLVDDEDPWVHALARVHLGKMRIVLGHGGRDADAYLKEAVEEFRALGERFGLSIALTELADRVATRGEFAAACEHYEQAIAAVTRVGAVEDVIVMRARQAQLYWLLGDKDASAAAVAEAHRYAERVTWPDALAELALAKAELARWQGDVAEAHRQLGVATGLLGDESFTFGVIHDLLGYLTDDLEEARTQRQIAWKAASEAGYAPLTARVIVGVAELALRRDQDEQAARLLAASAAVRGLADRAQPDVARIEEVVRGRLGDTRFAEVTQEGVEAEFGELVRITLAA
jgi:tetratricopeptide (TPR) repeat protein